MKELKCVNCPRVVCVEKSYPQYYPPAWVAVHLDWQGIVWYCPECSEKRFDN